MDRKIRKHIKKFNPCVEPFDERRHKDFLLQFDCGSKVFNEYLSGNEITDDRNNGDGVTFLVFNKVGLWKKELAAYYTIFATSIPFVSRIKLYPEDIGEDGKEYDEKLFGVNAVQIKLFAVDKKYQDTFYKQGKFDLPISAWILRFVIGNIDFISNNVCGVKAIFLHSVEEAEKFYLKNGFEYTDEKEEPFHSDDEDLKSMFLRLREIDICYDD